MKSYINSLADYRKVPFEREVTVFCPQEHIETNLKRLTRVGKKTVSADAVQKGDVVVLSLKSTLEKFNKDAVFITVGSNLFDAAFETQLLGKKQGEEFETEKDGKKVIAFVKSVSRKTYPEPSDALAVQYASDHEIEGIGSLEDYISYVKKAYIEEAKNNIFYDTVDSIVEFVLTHSDFAFDDGEINAFVDDDIEYIQSELAQEGKTLQTLSKDELKSYFGVETADDVREVIGINAERTIAQMLWLAKENGLNAASMELQDFENYGFDFLDEYVKNYLVIREENE